MSEIILCPKCGSDEICQAYNSQNGGDYLPCYKCMECDNLFGDNVPPPAIRYEFKPMEWEYENGVYMSVLGSIFETRDKQGFIFHSIYERRGVMFLNSIDEAKAAAEKHQQGLIEKLGGTRVLL